MKISTGFVEIEKSCPFCGHSEELKMDLDEERIVCGWCGAKGPSGSGCEDYFEAAAKYWDMRKDVPDPSDYE